MIGYAEALEILAAETDREAQRQTIHTTDDRHQQHGNERTDINRHIIHRECTIQMAFIALIEFRKQRRRVGLEDTITAGNGTQCQEYQRLIRAGKCHHRIADGQHDRAERDRPLRAEHLIAQITTDRYITIDHGAERTKNDERLCIFHAQALYKERCQHGLQAIVTETLPKLQEKEHVERFLTVYRM